MIKTIEEIIQKAEQEERNTLSEAETYQVLKKTGIPINKYTIINEKTDFEEASKEYDHIVVLKISSPDITHKTNINGVRIIENDPIIIEETVNQIIENTKKLKPKARINGVLMTQYIKLKQEILVSLLYDEQFQNFITLGIGGTMTEIYKDISIRLAPVTTKEIKEMLKELKGYPLIQGYRNKKGINQKKLISIIHKLNKLAKKFSKYSESNYIIKELEINPLAATEDEIIPIDGFLRFERKIKKAKTYVTTKGIEQFFYPKSVAVIGATEDKRPNGNLKEGNIIFQNLLKSKIKEVYPVNPKRKNVLGKKCYKSIKDIHQDIDLAVIVVPAKTTPKIIKELKEKKIKNAIIIGGGFGELGKKGKKLEDKIKATIKKGNIRIIGPNCLGTYFEDSQLNTVFLTEEKFEINRKKENNVTIITQSGAVGINLIQSLKNVGINTFVSVGNMIDNKTDYAALIKYFENEPRTAVTGIYVEGFKNGRRFYETAKKLKKPIIIIKGGKSKEGANATTSHTGSMAGNYQVAKAAFKQANIIEAKTSQEFADLIKVFSYLRKRKVRNNRIAIVSNAGGLGVLSADVVKEANLELAKYTELTKDRLNKYYENYLKENVGDNPTDLGGGVSDENFIKCLHIIIEDNNSDGIIVSPGIETQPMHEDHLIKNIICLFNQTKKPIVVTLPVNPQNRKLITLLEEANIPCYHSPERGVYALGKFMNYKLKNK